MANVNKWTVVLVFNILTWGYLYNRYSNDKAHTRGWIEAHDFAKKEADERYRNWFKVDRKTCRIIRDANAPPDVVGH